MAAYLVLLFAAFSRFMPHLFHAPGLGFTAVGGGLLFFGARRSRWQTAIAVAVLMATDFYLTTYVYNYPFHTRGYIVTWIWYAAVCLLGHQLLAGKPSALKVTAAVLTSTTSFFIISNFMVWVGGHMYAQSLAGLATCYVAAIPFYANDVMSTSITVGALFGLPALARSIAETIREAQNDRMPLA